MCLRLLPRRTVDRLSPITRVTDPSEPAPFTRYWRAPGFAPQQQDGRADGPVAEKLHAWLTRRLAEVAPGSATEKAIKYSLGRWVALTRYLEDGELPIDNNWLENRMRPVALGRANWLFAGSDRAGRRAAVIMSLIQTARLHGLDPYAYLRDVLERLPLTPHSQIEQLPPGPWKLRRPTTH